MFHSGSSDGVGRHDANDKKYPSDRVSSDGEMVIRLQASVTIVEKGSSHSGQLMCTWTGDRSDDIWFNLTFLLG